MSECELCHEEYLLRDGEDETPCCDHCAHVLVNELKDELAAVTVERDKYKAVVETISELTRLSDDELVIWKTKEGQTSCWFSPLTDDITGDSLTDCLQKAVAAKAKDQEPD
jgi:hypothetical protein